MYLCTLFLFNTLLTYFLIVDQTCFFVHKYILLIQLDVMDNFFDEVSSVMADHGGYRHKFVDLNYIMDL